MAQFVRVMGPKGRMRKLPICMVCAQVYTPKTRTPIAKLKTCSIPCREKWRLQNGLAERLRVIARLGKSGWTEESRLKYREKMCGSKNPAWKGGATYKRSKGNYVGPKYVRCPEAFKAMARKDGYVMEHRLVMAMHLGRNLDRIEVVHHKDHDTRNNAITNLELFPNNRAHKLAEAAESRGFNPAWVRR